MIVSPSMMPLGATRSLSPRFGLPLRLDAGGAGWLDGFRGAGVSARDLRILALALRKLGGARVEIGEALRALEEATVELIPAGRVYLLGATPFGPVVGSIISGVGIADGADGPCVVRVGRDGARTTLGGFAP